MIPRSCHRLVSRAHAAARYASFATHGYVTLVDMACDQIERAELMAQAPSVELHWDKSWRAIDDLPSSTATHCTGLLVRRAIVAREDLDAMPSLRHIVRMGVGYDNICVSACEERGVSVSNVPDPWVEEVADSTLCLLLSLARRTPFHAAVIRDDPAVWTPAADIVGTRRLRGQTLGIVGLGRIGTAVARRAETFGLKVGFHDPHVLPGMEKSLGGWQRHGSLDELLECSDFVSLHVPLDHSTHHLIGARELGAMAKRGAFLINTSRGGIVDDEALAAALGGSLGGAALDVLEAEPRVPAALHAQLLDQSGCPSAAGADSKLIITPHVSFYSDEAFADCRQQAAAEIARVLKGEPPLYRVSK